jgi:hypothetical protein
MVAVVAGRSCAHACPARRAAAHAATILSVFMLISPKGQARTGQQTTDRKSDTGRFIAWAQNSPETRVVMLRRRVKELHRRKMKKSLTSFTCRRNATGIAREVKELGSLTIFTCAGQPGPSTIPPRLAYPLQARHHDQPAAEDLSAAGRQKVPASRMVAWPDGLNRSVIFAKTPKVALSLPLKNRVSTRKCDRSFNTAPGVCWHRYR